MEKTVFSLRKILARNHGPAPSSPAPRTRGGIPVITLDPSGADHHGEAARLRDLGPAVPVVLPGGVSAWAVSRHAELAALVNDPRISKDWRQHWSAYRRGEIPEGWPLGGMVFAPNLIAADGDEHRRLRRPVTRDLTPRRVQALRPGIEAITGALLDDLPSKAGTDGTADLRPHFAYPLPLQVICEMLGVPGPWRPRLRQLVDSLFRTDTTPEEAARTLQGRDQMMADLIALRTREPGDDLISALIAARRDGNATLSDEELAHTLWVLLAAGHETTATLITNAARALLTHPDQRELAVSGGLWEAVIEETLRNDAPIGNFMARYPRQAIEIGGVTVPKGDAILACYSAAGRDPRRYGNAAASFDIGNATSRHLAFGGGSHACPGAALARAEAAIAIRRLFTRYPDLALAVPPDELRPVPSLFTNSAATLPVRLGPRADSPGLPAI
jgi:cytochrome P450